VFALPTQPGWYLIQGYRIFSGELYAASEPFPVYDNYTDPCPVGQVVACDGSCASEATYVIDHANELCFGGCPTPDGAMMVLDRDQSGEVDALEWFPWAYGNALHSGGVYDLWSMSADTQGLVGLGAMDALVLPCSSDPYEDGFYCADADEILTAVDQFAPAGADVGELMRFGAVLGPYASVYAWFDRNAPPGGADLALLGILEAELDAVEGPAMPCEPLCVTAENMLGYFDGFDGLAPVDGFLEQAEWEQLAYYGPQFAPFGELLDVAMRQDKATSLPESQSIIDLICPTCLPAAAYDMVCWPQRLRGRRWQRGYTGLR